MNIRNSETPIHKLVGPVRELFRIIVYGGPELFDLKRTIACVG
jgi:hypothetical protein